MTLEEALAELKRAKSHRDQWRRTAFRFHDEVEAAVEAGDLEAVRAAVARFREDDK